MQCSIYNDEINTETILLIDGPTRSHTHTKRKETRSFYWTLQPMRETSWGSEFGWHLWVIKDPSRTCGTRGSCRPVWRIVGFTKQARTPRNSHREQTASKPDQPPLKLFQTHANSRPHTSSCTERLRDISPPTRGGALARIISLSVPH